jgi:excisionase family DNA binding protein
MLKIGKNKEFLTVKEMADILGVSRITVFNRIKKGEIKAEKIGRNYAIKKNDVGFLFPEELTEKRKKEIDFGVNKVVVEYGDVLKKLGQE